MSKKEKEQEATYDPFADGISDGDAGEFYDADSGINFETDFNVDEEYKPIPLAPKGNYFGHVTEVVWDGQNSALVWSVTLSDQNEGAMSDGSPIAGQVYDYRNWFPKAGDENEKSARGNQTKRQSKINMIKDFSTKMKVDMNSPQAIITAIQNQDWVGIPVVATLVVKAYQGRFRNEISGLQRQASN